MGVSVTCVTLGVRTHVLPLGLSMNFESITALARRTPTVVLGGAWGLSQNEIDSRLNGRESMTVRDLGGLADIYGVRVLLDALNSTVDEVARADIQGV